MTKAEAMDLVQRQIQQTNKTCSELVIRGDLTIEREFGWVFFYNTKRFVETGDLRSALFGNGPIFVNRYSGDVRAFGSGREIDDVIREYEGQLSQGSDKT